MDKAPFTELAWALDAARAGWKFAPVSITLDPKPKKDGSQAKLSDFHRFPWSSSTSDPAMISSWIQRGWGLALDCDGSGLVVVDVDSPEALAWFLAFGEPTGCLISITAGGGRHFIYRAHPTRIIRNSKGTDEDGLAPKVDIRGGKPVGGNKGGVIYVPGTTTGEYGSGIYTWANGTPTAEQIANLAVIPDYIVDLHGEDGTPLRKAKKALRRAATTEPDFDLGPGWEGTAFGSSNAPARNENTHDWAWYSRWLNEATAELHTAHENGTFHKKMFALAALVGEGIPSLWSYEKAYDELVKLAEVTFPNGANDQDHNHIRNGLNKGHAKGVTITERHASTPLPAVLAGLAPEAAALELAPGNLPREFWECRPALRLIRDVAHQRLSAADAVFGGVLARIAAALPPECGPDTGIGGSTTSLNLIVALVAPSGGGKSSGLKVVDAVMPENPRWNPYTLPLGSGEGIAEAYMGTEKVEDEETGKQSKVRKQIYSNALLHKDEGAELMRMLERQGSTVSEALRSAWSGETLGQQNGRAETTRIIPAGSYSLGLTIGFQPGIAGRLFTSEQQELGTVQRFVWLAATDPTIPDEVETFTEERLQLIQQDPWDPAKAMFDLNPGHAKVEIRKMTIADTIRARLRVERLAKQRGTVEIAVLDSHRPLLLVKLSCIMAVLDSRLDVTEEDWALAEQILSVSNVMRVRIQRELAIQQERDRIASLKRREQEASASERGRQAELAACIPKHLEHVVRKLGEAGKPVGKRAMRDWINGTHRSCWGDVLGQGVESGVLKLEGGLYSLAAS